MVFPEVLTETESLTCPQTDKHGLEAIHHTHSAICMNEIHDRQDDKDVTTLVAGRSSEIVAAADLTNIYILYTM